MRYHDSDVPADTLSANEIDAIRSTFKFYNRDNLIPRLVATIDALIEHMFDIHQ